MSFRPFPVFISMIIATHYTVTIRAFLNRARINQYFIIRPFPFVSDVFYREFVNSPYDVCTFPVSDEFSGH